MARILIVYGTNHGHTAKICEVLAQDIRRAGAEADVREAAARPSPDGYDAIVVAASVRAGSYQRPVMSWVKAHAGSLASRPTAFLSVCLGILQNDPRVTRELDAIVARFLTATGWRPDVTKHVAGALPYTRYNWLVRLTMRRMVRKAGGDTSRDYEYTDWKDIAAFAAQFTRQVVTIVDGAPRAAASA